MSPNRRPVALLLVIGLMCACGSGPDYVITGGTIVFPVNLDGQPMPEGFAEDVTRVFREYEIGKTLEDSRIRFRTGNQFVAYKIRMQVNGQTSYLDLHRGVAKMVLTIGDVMYEIKPLPLYAVVAEHLIALDPRGRARLNVDFVNEAENLML
jgi:hypothetical protein